MIKNLKKVISTLAAVAILATSASAFAVSFPDVDANASYAGAVDALTTLGVVNGDDNGKFNPENTVTRAEFAKMVVEALGAGNEAASSTDTKFVDAKGHWAAGYIETGVAKKFINGYDEKTFGPDDKVTYAQAVKMLVAAIGYETYASNQGGWPSGYLAYGSELDIIAGVTGVSNDTALTRAQCAILVYNTLKAPICVINGYNEIYDGNGLVSTPKLEKKDGEGKDWQTLLTTKHDAWVVRGRVTGSVVVDAVKGDTVPFRIEAAENFENAPVKAKKVEDEIVDAVEIDPYVGSSKAADMLFAYSEAIIQKDADTSEYTIVSITPYGAVKTVEFAAKDIKEALEDGKIKVKKDNTTKTNDYKVADTAEVFVNGASEGAYETAVEATAVVGGETVYTFAPIHANNTGVVTLVNETSVASTSTDDEYDYVMVTYYETGYVTSVDADDEEATIEIAAINGDVDGAIVIDLEEDPTRKITFIKDGAEISYEDVKKDDIVSIAYEWGGDWETDDIEVIVSDKVVSGTATGRSTAKNTVTVDGTAYDYAYGDIELGNNYDLYLDAFGCIVKAEANATNKALGIVVGAYDTNDDYKVKLITADGKVETYPTTEAEWAKFNAVAADSIDDAKDAVVEYKFDSNGNIKCKDDDVAVVDDADAEYMKELSLLGGYQISETATKIIALGSYFDDGKVSAMTVDQLEDEAKYEVFMANEIGDVYGLVVITGDLAALGAKSTLAVVMATGETTTVNDETVDVVTVAVNGDEDVDVYFEDATGIEEGDIIMYRVGTEGYVEVNADTNDDDEIDLFNYIVVRSANDTVDAMYTEVFANAVSFTATIASDLIKDTDSDGTYTLTINDDNDDEEVEVYYGPVYTASESSLRIFKNKTDAGVSNFGDVKTFSIGNANVYSYNYEKEVNEKVTASGLTQDKSFFKLQTSQPTYDWATGDDNDEGFETNIKPRMAFVRVVDNVVTDVVYYRAK